MNVHHSTPSARSLAWLIISAFTIIIARLAYLQVYGSLQLLYRSKRNYLRYEHIISPRGTIYDSQGKLLATNRPLIKLIWKGTGNRLLTPEQIDNFAQIKGITESPLDQETIARGERQRRHITVDQDLSFDQLSIILEQFPNDKNLTLETYFQRYYPCGSIACHVLGYINDVTTHQNGIMGLEKACENTLRGMPGQLLKTINSYGHQLAQQAIQQAQTGGHIYTTLDCTLQELAEQAFPEEYDGAFLVMEAKTGALRVVLSRPSFDPNIFTKPIPAEVWQELIDKKTFLNRAFSACYPPASPFKLVTMVAALDTHLVDQHETWFCPGYTIFHGRPYHCNNKLAHGHVTIEDALAKSCNVPLFDIGKRIKINTLATYAHWLGLGTPTNSIVGEKIGIIPTTQWKQEVFGEPWWPGETLSATIGQSFLLVTPIQVCRMIGTICEGFSVTPHLIEGTPVEKVVPPIQPHVLQYIKNSMRWVVTRGTGQQLRTLNMIIYAKTGTAQTCNIRENRTNITKESLPHGWFVAHVTYQNEPSFVVVALVEHAGGSRVAVEVVKKFLRSYEKHVLARDQASEQ